MSQRQSIHEWKVTNGEGGKSRGFGFSFILRSIYVRSALDEMGTNGKLLNQHHLKCGRALFYFFYIFFYNNSGIRNFGFKKILIWNLESGVSSIYNSCVNSLVKVASCNIYFFFFIFSGKSTAFWMKSLKYIIIEMK